MAIKGVFVDFYGTCVHEDNEAVELISNEIYETSVLNAGRRNICEFWWNEFSQLFNNACDNTFQNKRNLMTMAIASTVHEFKSSADPVHLAEFMFKQWQRPNIFAETKAFFEKCPYPIYILSNADRNDIECAVSYHKLTPQAIITSEDAFAYKPRKEFFTYALNQLGFAAYDVIHIGDTISSDVVGAFQVGIDVIWLNRYKKPVSEFLDKTMVSESLMDSLKIIEVLDSKNE